jgi:aerotolerance regulator-like protein
MQFKYPELLWALFLLLIPIFIHLFQLRRFKKTPFTNVKLLQKVVSESRRSNSLKKWLLLATRLLLFTALIIAFAQPFFAKKIALQDKETVIYLDDSFSMQAKTDQRTLLSNAVQELIKSVPDDKTFSLFTNKTEYRNVSLKDIRNDLLTIEATPKQLDLEEIYLKASALFSKAGNRIKNLVLISDFQKTMSTTVSDSSNTIQKHLVQLSPDDLDNISLDTVFISSQDLDNIELTVGLTTYSKIQNTPISLYDRDRLIAKTSAVFEDNKGTVVFTLPAREAINGRFEISDMGLTYDNNLHFNIDVKEKPKVLVIGEVDSDYLRRIYTEGEFLFSSFGIKNLNYRDIDLQNLIILNELDHVSNSLIASLTSFVANGGNLVVIPGVDSNLDSYNQLLTKFSVGSYIEKVAADRNITQISFSHPLYKNVFEKKIQNFQYPQVSQFFRTSTNGPSILSYQNGQPFLTGANGIYVFTASLSDQNSNFKQSPLIVPTFYKMGANSLNLPDLYSTIGSLTQIDVTQRLSKDHILKVFKEDYEFIPQQRSQANKVSLIFNETPTTDGIFGVSENGNTLMHISFNYPRNESELDYLEINNLQFNSKQGSISSLFQNLQNDNSVTELWKWFVILAVLFILIEVLIIKYLKQ